MFWWAFSLPFQGISLLLSRTFFSLQRTWATTVLAGLNLLVNVLVSALLYRPLGVAGIVIGTVAGTVGMTVAQALALRRDLGGVEGLRTLSAAARMLVAAGLQGAVSFGLWRVLDGALGRSLAAQMVTVAGAIAAGLVVYALAVSALRVAEARQIRELLIARLRRRD